MAYIMIWVRCFSLYVAVMAKKYPGDDTIHGGISPHSAAAPPESFTQVSMVGVRHPISNGDGSVRGLVMVMW